VGVSRDQSRQTTINGSAILESLTRFGYRGRIDLVHPEATEIGGRKVYSSIRAIPEAPDLIVLSLSAARIPDAIEEAGAKGIRGAVVMAAGFSELGGEGEALERRMKASADRHKLRICGPNGLGYLNVTDGTYAGYFPCLSTERPRTGGLAIVTHSGAVGNSLLARAVDRGIGFSYVISAGNETNVTLADYIHFLTVDPNTRVISLYMEGVIDGRALRQALHGAVEAGKSVIVYKVGKSSAGAKAALSHTAKVAGEPALYRGLFRQLGVIEAQCLDDLIEIPMLMLKCARGGAGVPRGVGIVTISGGLGAIMADHFVAEGFCVPELAGTTKESLERVPLKFGSVLNPVDLTGAIQRSEAMVSDILATVAADPAVDAIVFPNASRFPQRAVELAKIMRDAATRFEKPLISVWYAGSDNDPAMRVLHEDERVACFDDPSAAARALAALRDTRLHAQRSPEMPAASPERVAAESVPKALKGLLTEPEGKAVLRAYGVSLPRETVAIDATTAAKAAEAIGFPVALKIVSPDIPHKAKVGGVALSLWCCAEVLRAFEAMMKAVAKHAPHARVEGVLVTEMVAVDVELIVGSYIDPRMGPALVIGAGGGDVEALPDISMCLLPVTDGDCARALDSLHDRRIRSLAPAKKSALVSAIARVAAMAWDLQPRLFEMDVNPMALTRQGAVLALDAMMNFREEARGNA